MDTALILADQLLSLIRSSGVSRIEADAALGIAQAALPTICFGPRPKFADLSLSDVLEYLEERARTPFHLDTPPEE